MYASCGNPTWILNREVVIGTLTGFNVQTVGSVVCLTVTHSLRVVSREGRQHEGLV
jgi:hypothetical protein